MEISFSCCSLKSAFITTNSRNIIKFYYFAKWERNEETRETIKLKAIAQRKFPTWNPGTINVISQTRNALIINVKSPSVTKFIGNVKSSSIGFTKVLKIPKAIATKKPVIQLSILIPGRIRAANITAIVLMTR